MIEFDDFMLVIAKPELYDNCRGFAGVGMPHHRAGSPFREGVLERLGLGWLARCLFCETPDRMKSSRSFVNLQSPKALLAGSATLRRGNIRVD